MNEQNKNIETFHLPNEREFSPNDVDPSIIVKLGSKVAHIMIEKPDDMATEVLVHHEATDEAAETIDGKHRDGGAE